jgi:hypothetical protein
MKTYAITGEKNGETKTVFHSITMEDFKRIGEKNAREHGYNNFTLYEQWTLDNRNPGKIIKIA